MLLLTPRIRGVGGIAQHVRCLAEQLEEAGYQVYILSSETLRTPRIKGAANPLYSLASAFKLLGRSYDIVHGHNLPSAPGIKASKAQVKILTLHGHYSRQIRLLYGEALGRLAERAEQLAISWVDGVTAVSRAAADYYRRRGAHVEHIPNAVKLSEMPRRGERVSDPQVTYLGRLSKEKGVDLLIEAAAHHGVKGLVLAGDGPLKPLVEYAAGKKLLTYLGALPRWRALRVLKGSDIAVLPSREEGISTVLLEAMACRVPVVATRVGGTVEVVREGVDALLVKPDASEIAEAVKRLLQDREQASRLSENAYRRVGEKYSWERVGGLYLNLYRRLLEGNLK